MLIYYVSTTSGVMPTRLNVTSRVCSALPIVRRIRSLLQFLDKTESN